MVTYRIRNTHISIFIVDIALYIAVSYFGNVFANIRDKGPYFLSYILCALKPLSITSLSLVQKVLATTRKSLLKKHGSSRRTLDTTKLNKKYPTSKYNIDILERFKRKKSIEYIVARDVVHRRYRGFLYYQNVIRC
jgi:hypothetical protein